MRPESPILAAHSGRPILAAILASSNGKDVGLIARPRRVHRRHRRRSARPAVASPARGQRASQNGGRSGQNGHSAFWPEWTSVLARMGPGWPGQGPFWPPGQNPDFSAERAAGHRAGIQNLPAGGPPARARRFAAGDHPQSPLDHPRIILDHPQSPITPVTDRSVDRSVADQLIDQCPDQLIDQ